MLHTNWVTVTLTSDLVFRIIMLEATPIHESSAFQLFIFHIYILSFSFFVIIRNVAHLEKVKSINESVILFGILGSYLFLHIWENILLKLGK